MTKWVAVLALVLSISGIILYWFDCRNNKERVTSLETQLNSTVEETKNISEKLSSLMALKESAETEVLTLQSSPAEFIDVLSAETVEKGLFNIQTRIKQVHLRNRSRFNVRYIQIMVWYLDEDQIETGVTAKITVPHVLVAGESKQFEVDSPWMDGRPGAKMQVQHVDVVGG